jgi:hypothetical protein
VQLQNTISSQMTLLNRKNNKNPGVMMLFYGGCGYLRPLGQKHVIQADKAS